MVAAVGVQMGAAGMSVHAGCHKKVVLAGGTLVVK
jgi:hypothetical protein